MFQYLKVKLRECLYSVLLFLANHRYNGQTLLMYDAHEETPKGLKSYAPYYLKLINWLLLTAWKITTTLR